MGVVCNTPKQLHLQHQRSQISITNIIMKSLKYENYQNDTKWARAVGKWLRHDPHRVAQIFYLLKHTHTHTIYVKYSKVKLNNEVCLCVAVERKHLDYYESSSGVRACVLGKAVWAPRAWESRVGVFLPWAAQTWLLSSSSAGSFPSQGFGSRGASLLFIIHE